ncbi:FIST N-terminal domain-containing protein [Thalassovita sp.]|uniref:FIST N-terminal domain-containing protein n=1 Tax=Thalassovita sp. TaxID=1979401 RepID=UPI0029DE62BF|nr:FIST N-terminal domain-containing protein [Thalassovita sp.]
MEQPCDLSGALEGVSDIVRSACVDARAPDGIRELAGILKPADLDLVVLFVSPASEVQVVAAEAAAYFAPARVVGCTTAGELCSQGYSDGKIVAIGFPRQHFCTRVTFISDLDNYDQQDLIGNLIRNRNDMTRETPDWHSECAMLLVDGLTMHEDQLTSQLSMGVGPVPLFGGSAGDGDRFEKTFVLHDGRACENAAVVVQLRTDCDIEVFNTDHLRPTENRMVVTGADPARRIVHEINAEPAAREYARLLGKDPEQLTSFTFAAHPVVVRIGNQHHVRSIQKMESNGDLVFFSAIDEGVVLTLAESTDMVVHLRNQMTKLNTRGKPDSIIAFDCIFRRMEAEQMQLAGQLSNILAEHNVVGLSTYGEQINSRHVNQTLTGVAIYPPKEG